MFRADQLLIIGYHPSSIIHRPPVCSRPRAPELVLTGPWVFANPLRFDPAGFPVKHSSEVHGAEPELRLGWCGVPGTELNMVPGDEGD